MQMREATCMHGPRRLVGADRHVGESMTMPPKFRAGQPLLVAFLALSPHHRRVYSPYNFLCLLCCRNRFVRQQGPPSGIIFDQARNDDLRLLTRECVVPVYQFSRNTHDLRDLHRWSSVRG